MNALVVRIVSAVIAGLLLIACYYFFGDNGLRWISLAVVFAGLLEYKNMMLSKVPRVSSWVFMVFGTIILVGVGSNEGLAIHALPLSISIFWTAILWANRERATNDIILSLGAYGALGFILCGLFPGLLIATLTFENGTHWFIAHLVIVFAGDIGAFFGGRTLGKNRLMPSLSPKKTIEGMISGWIFAVGCGTLFGHLWGQDIPLIVWALASGIISFVAQSGDLFMSLLKRTSGVKDTGTIMPGHGGVLDRLDGVYLAAPLMYFLAKISPKLSAFF